MALFVMVKRNGKRFRRNLDTTDLAEAKRRAKEIIGKVKGEKWDELRGLRTRQERAAHPRPRNRTTVSHPNLMTKSASS